MNKLPLLLLLLAGCPHHGHDDKKDATASPRPGLVDARARAPVADDGLPPAPPLPPVPAGLPPLPDTPALSAVTPDALALGTLLFYEPRLSAGGRLACATCHDPAHGYSGAIDNAADGKPNLRRTPALVNLAWATAFDWDGRYSSLDDLLPAHVHGQLGDALEPAAIRLAETPIYKAHFARVGGAPQDAVRTALAAFVLTRYAGDAPWDRREASARVPKPGVTPDPETAGYLLFTTKGQCAVCHTPPLYTDGGFHRIGKLGVPDEGRGRVDPSAKGAFKTPSLRGAAARAALFHTGDTATLDAAVDFYRQLGASEAHARHPDLVDDAAATIQLSAAEGVQLVAFLRALSAPAAVPPPPKLPPAP